MSPKKGPDPVRRRMRELSKAQLQQILEEIVCNLYWSDRLTMMESWSRRVGIRTRSGKALTTSNSSPASSTMLVSYQAPATTMGTEPLPHTRHITQ